MSKAPWSGLTLEEDRQLSEMFNSKPYDFRKVGAAMETRVRIQQEWLERQRLQDQIAKTDQRIKAQQENLRKQMRELSGQSENA